MRLLEMILTDGGGAGSDIGTEIILHSSPFLRGEANWRGRVQDLGARVPPRPSPFFHFQASFTVDRDNSRPSWLLRKPPPKGQARATTEREWRHFPLASFELGGERTTTISTFQFNSRS